MSQVITHAVALTLKKGTIIYHNVLEFGMVEGQKTPATARVTGPCRDHHYEGFALPIKRLYGAEGEGLVTRISQDLWRTTPEKVVEHRVARTRHSATAVEILEAPEVEPEPVRVRRTRTVPAPARVSRVRGR